MIKKLRILPYKMGSQSSKNIVRELGGLRVYPDRRYRPRSNHLIVNWGSSKLPNWYDSRFKILNNPVAVSRATNKITTLQLLRDSNVSVVPFTTDYEEAWDFLSDEVNSKDRIVLRHKVNGTKGEGIEIVDGSIAFHSAPLYTKFISNAREYRVHVFQGNIIDVQQKKRRNRENEDVERISGGIKNLSNGWVFCRENLTEYPQKMLDESIKAVSVLGLDFGAVDVLVKSGEIYILEINTAMGLCGATLSKYVNEIKKLLYA